MDGPVLFDERRPFLAIKKAPRSFRIAGQTLIVSGIQPIQETWHFRASLNGRLQGKLADMYYRQSSAVNECNFSKRGDL